MDSIDRLNLEELSAFLPNNIKLEIIKLKLKELYNMENKYIDMRNKKEKNLIDSVDLLKINNLPFRIRENYRKLSIIIKSFNLPDEIISDLYVWSKREREKMELSDNLYNIFDLAIYIGEEYDELNKNINSKAKF